ncbi:MarR family winged helix-turn-helix transcriptional regulator [Arthrobacter sp. ZGTC412]|uniref:MarR family winged helix-turn-helix transcriptional regulator n=1 Tax=Arthrobacter sp. ZGTC412 TaxID=2058900 RepID=UPI000CE3E6FE|nr:MarR family transcriptional regulator [Arthrobacter sp. ZGTC412]
MHAETSAAPEARTAGWFIYMLKQLDMGLRPSMEQSAGVADLTAAQFTALSVLAVRQGLSSSELARRSFVRAQSMAETVTPLIKRGLVTRQRDTEDRRSFVLFITDEGRKMLQLAQQDVAGVEEQLLNGLAPGQRDDLASLLRVCRSNLLNGRF